MWVSLLNTPKAHGFHLTGPMDYTCSSAVIFVRPGAIDFSSRYVGVVQWPLVISFYTAIYKPFNQLFLLVTANIQVINKTPRVEYPAHCLT